MLPTKTRFVALLTVLSAVLGAGSAQASGLLDFQSCNNDPRAAVFARWADPMTYRLAPGGDFESTPSGWETSGSANVVSGNETYYLHSASDTHSMSLGAGASATSPETCVSLYEPAARFMVKSTGSALGVLRVDALYRDATGALGVVPVGVVTGLGSGWQPSLPMDLSLGLVPSAGADATNLRLRFTVTGVGGAFSIDDVYVDPFGRG